MRKERGSSRPEDKGRPGLQKDCFWPFGPHFGPNITEGGGGGGGGGPPGGGGGGGGGRDVP